MKLEQFESVCTPHFAEALAWAYRVTRIGQNAWIIHGSIPGEMLVCYEHPRGKISPPPVGYRLQFHTDDDGFASPSWSIQIDARITFHPRGM